MPTHSSDRAQPGIALTVRDSYRPRHNVLIVMLDWGSWIVGMILTGTVQIALGLWKRRRNLRSWSDVEWTECAYLIVLLAAFFTALKYWVDTKDPIYFAWVGLAYLFGPMVLTMLYLLVLSILFLFGGAWRDKEESEDS